MTIEEIMREMRKHLDYGEFPTKQCRTKLAQAKQDAEFAKWKSDNEKWVATTLDTFHLWLKRGDHIAVYENKALDSINCGHKVYIPFDTQPPERMPDTGLFSTPWAYYLLISYHLEGSEISTQPIEENNERPA